jgi:phosphoribosyl-AMP cyclohydrolase
VQILKSAALDCDGDVVLLKVDQSGGACHTGDRTCFDAGDLPLGEAATASADRAPAERGSLGESAA